MSIKSTLSFHMGTRFNEKHNNRTIPCPMADSNYEKQHNWYHPKNMSLEQAYEILFAESFNEYNSSIRKDRRYNSYLEKLQIAQQKEQEKIAELRQHRSDKIIADAWEEFNSATSAYFYQYREKKKMLFEEIQRARCGAKDSRKRLNSILNDIAYGNDLFVVKLLKLVFALFMAIETSSMERRVQQLQERNQQIKALAKEVMSTSQIVSAELRSGDIERINAVLSEYEYQLKQAHSEILSSRTFVNPTHNIPTR